MITHIFELSIIILQLLLSHNTFCNFFPVDPNSRLVAIEKALEKLTIILHENEKQVRFIQAQVNVCRKSR